MEREIVTVTTPIGNHKIEIKKWLTGRERREIQRVYIDDTTFKTTEENQEQGEQEFSGSKIYEAQNKTIEMTVQSVNGKTENVLDAVLDMRSEDFDFVIEELNKVNKEEQKDLKEPKENTTNS